MDRVGKALVVTGSVLSLWSFFVLLRTSPPAPSSRTVSLASNAHDNRRRYEEIYSNETRLPPEVVDFFSKTPEPFGKVSSRDDIDIKLANSYTRVSPTQTGEKYAYPWKYVAEPYRATTMTVVGADESSFSYTWYVDGHVQGFGTEVDVAWTSTGWKRVAAVASSGEFVAVDVMVKYVRREIRTLTDRDRETFFQGVMIMQRVPTEVGKTIFGDSYYSKDYFNRLHVNYGGSSDCDHWHTGAGFVTSHVTITLQFEQSLQSIYPDVTVPYWDFTIESTFYDAETFRESPVFSSDWFGAASPDNELHTVTKGRWAFARIRAGATEFSEVTNSYGMLRAPWNNDPTPFLTRHRRVYGYENNMKPSGCNEYSMAIQKSDWMSLAKIFNSAAHGHIHEVIGGSWNSLLNDTVDPAVLEFTHEIQALSKDLYRAGFVECPEQCSMDTPWRECECRCSAETVGGGPAKSYDILYQAGVLNAVHYYDSAHHQILRWIDENNNGTVYYDLPGYTAEQSQRIYDGLLKILCNPGHIGDMFQASSSSDVIFWVLHPSIDRLWHYKRLGSSENFDETWYSLHSCYGHDPDNLQPFRSVFSGGDDDDFFYTNSELYDRLRPDAPTIPYMYDNFAWPHCEFIGMSISNR